MPDNILIVSFQYKNRHISNISFPNICSSVTFIITVTEQYLIGKINSKYGFNYYLLLILIIISFVLNASSLTNPVVFVFFSFSVTLSGYFIIRYLESITLKEEKTAAFVRDDALGTQLSYYYYCC